MKLKSYFSGTVEAALELARKDLGEDALLINARPATLETRHLGAYEIVFGVPAREVAPPVPAPMPRPMARSSPRDSTHAAHDSEALSGRDTGRHTDSHAIRPAARAFSDELDPRLAQAVARGTPLENLFETDATLGAGGGRRAVVMLVGPPGVGKTTTLVKLAARYGLATRRRTHIVSTDVYRIAAADQLRALASILGIGLDVVDTPGALAQALEEHASKDLVLIDTPGLSTSEMEDGLELANFVSSEPAIDTHLVLSASTKPADLTRMADSYAVFGPSKLLFTRIDETAEYGALVSEAARRRIPISFLATGQRIPDDIEPATRRRLVALVEGRGLRADAHRSVSASA